MTMEESHDQIEAEAQLKARIAKAVKFRTLLKTFSLTSLVMILCYGPLLLLSSAVGQMGIKIIFEFIVSAWIILQSVLGILLFLYPVSSIIVLLQLQHWLNEFSRTNRLEIQPDGLAFGWARAPMRVLPWHEITSVFLFRPAHTMMPKKWLVGFGTMGTRPINIKMDLAIAMGPKLIEALKANCPWVSIDPDLIELFEPAIEDNRTELWLKSINQAPQEEQLLPLAPGDSLRNGRFLIISRIGVGGQGTAYLARDLESEADRALKETLFPVYVDSGIREEYEMRFQKEVELLGRFDHPSVVRLLDSFIEEHRGYLVLDLVDGLSLRQIVRSMGKLAEDRVIDYGRQMCETLIYLHKLSPPVVHRDFTPDNLLLDPDGKLILIDFNVARELVSNKTATVVGKHAYIPPEQFRGHADIQSDIYAMGCTMNFLLTGEDPLAISRSSPKEKFSSISEELNSIVEKATEQDLNLRYKNAEEVLTDLLLLSATFSAV